MLGYRTKTIPKSLEERGVHVEGTKRNTMKNCNVSHSKRSGLYMWNNGLMTISGKDTTIHHNCTGGRSGDYGLEASASFHPSCLTFNHRSSLDE